MDNEQIDAMMAQMFMQAQMQFGNAIKGFWFYGDDLCPGCGGEVDATIFEGERAISLNAYIYRPQGMLIGYVLCGRCGDTVIKAKKQGPLHKKIEANLTKAYRRQMH